MAYDLKSVQAPRLHGLGLRLATAALESRLLRPLVLPGLLKKSGITAFRQRRSDAAPTARPPVESTTGLSEPATADGIALAEAVTGDGAPAPPAAPGFRFASISDYARAYRDGSSGPEAIAERVIAAIAASNQTDLPLRAIIQSDTDDLRAQAADSARRLAAGEARSLLEGVPVAIKDELDQRGYRTRVGTRFLGDEAATSDAATVARLRAAGALLIGKTNMFEIGISPTGDNPIHGLARNPYDPHRDTGGSSSGCGGAVASGLAPLALGADGGGSIRVPSAHCGIVGLKPTYGRVSEFGAAPLCWSLCHIGPMAGCALDAAIGYAICAGRDDRDPMTRHQPPVELDAFHQTDLRGIRLGWYPDWFEDAAPEVVRQCRDGLARLEAAGASLHEVTIEGLEAARVAQGITILSEMAAAMHPHYRAHRRDFAHATRMNLVLGRHFTATDYVLAQRIRTESIAEWDRVLNEVDAVVTPTCACPPSHLEPGIERYGRSDLGHLTELMRFVSCANFTGLPAISFPAGYTGQGLPVGLQVIGRRWQESLLLRLAAVAELGLERRKPVRHFDLLASA